jgi:hypothetical protein
MARTATIGPAIYERVGKLVAGGKTRTEAFAEVAKERKSSPGTVAANYYRVARQEGEGRKQTAKRGRAAARRRSATQRGIYAAQQGRGNGRAGSDGDLASLAREIRDLTQELVRRVEERDRAIRRILG